MTAVCAATSGLSIVLSTRPSVRRRGAVPRVASCVCVRSFPPRGRQPLLSPGSLRTVEPRADGEAEEEEEQWKDRSFAEKPTALVRIIFTQFCTRQ